MEETYPDSISIALGNFIFLRFINPAFLNPEVIGLSECNIYYSLILIYSAFHNKVSDKMRRTLVLVVKVLQNLANEQKFGGKEKFMEPLNSFIAQNKNTLSKFYDELLVLF